MRFICDNQAVVHSIEAGTSHCPLIMHLLCNLFYTAARHNYTISAQHLPGKQNVIADFLSCFNMQAFRVYAPTAALLPPHPVCPQSRYDQVPIGYNSHIHLSHLYLSAPLFYFAIIYYCLAPDGSLLLASEDTLMLFTTFLAFSLRSQSKYICSVSETCTYSMGFQTLYQMPSNIVAYSAASSDSKALLEALNLQSPHIFSGDSIAYFT